MINEIRNAFSKASVVVNDRGISVYYTYKERWVSNGMESDSVRVFADLIRSSEAFGIGYRAGKFVRFFFQNAMEGQSVVFYHPLTEEVSLEELQIALDPEEIKTSEFLDFFMGVDLNDEDEVLEKLREWISKKGGESNILGINGLFKWPELRAAAFKVAGIFGCELECTEPDSITDGCAEIKFPEGNKSILIRGKTKDLFERLVRLSSGVGIECNVRQGFLNLSFFA